MSYVMPALILLLLGYALCKRVNVYDAFTRGAGGAAASRASASVYGGYADCDESVPFLRCAFRAHFLD